MCSGGVLSYAGPMTAVASEDVDRSARRLRRLAPRFASALALAALIPSAFAGDLQLAANGKTSYSVVIAGAAADPKNAEDPERHAAEELARFLSEISGA